ncbi:MAG: antibiotic biosynthesis monooxygenase [Fimbriimonadaceae bacterium]|nr:antibiotic biosynthesis monooxygenase [Fimbriimonadaceae bacterium]
MTLKNLCLVGFGIAFGVCIGITVPKAQAQSQQGGGQGVLTVRDFPDLVSGLKATPGCMQVKTSSFNDGKQFAIYAWFKNKAAVDAWYNSPMHREAMKKFFPNMPGKAHSLTGFKDEKSPLLVVATVTPSDKPTVEGSPLAVSQIAIEIYTPVPGGVAVGGSFGPKEMEVPGLIRMQ